MGKGVKLGLAMLQLILDEEVGVTHIDEMEGSSICLLNNTESRTDVLDKKESLHRRSDCPPPGYY